MDIISPIHFNSIYVQLKATTFEQIIELYNLFQFLYGMIKPLQILKQSPHQQGISKPNILIFQPHQSSISNYTIYPGDRRLLRFSAPH